LLRVACLATAALIGLGLVSITAVKVHESFLLAKAPKDWNATQLKNIRSRLSRLPNPNEFTFAVFGDNKNSVGTFNRVIDNLNREKRLAFAIDMGDLVFMGDNVMYRLYIDQLKRLKVPLLTVIGNHDLDPGTTANAKNARDSNYGSLENSKNYQKMFGSTYYSFTLGTSYFVMLDISDEHMDLTTKQEKYFEDELAWFEDELQKAQAYENIFVVSHVPIFKGKRDLVVESGGYVQDKYEKYLQDKDYAVRIKELALKYKVDAMLASHIHTFDVMIWPRDDIESDPADILVLLVSGAAGARLWQTNDVRMMHSYTLVDAKEKGAIGVEIDPLKRPGFRVTRIKNPVESSTYLYFEKPRVYTYACVANNYYWMMPACSLVFLGLLALYLLSRRRARAVTRPDGSSEA
jgi:hypothetical protein